MKEEVVTMTLCGLPSAGIVTWRFTTNMVDPASPVPANPAEDVAGGGAA